MKQPDASTIMSALLAAAFLGGEAEDKEKETPKPNGDEIRKQAEDVGNAYFHLYLGFKDAGFNDDQAFQLMMKTVGGNE